MSNAKKEIEILERYENFLKKHGFNVWNDEMGFLNASNGKVDIFDYGSDIYYTIVETGEELMQIGYDIPNEILALIE